MNAAENLDEGGFAGAVITDEGEHFARVDVEIDFFECGNVGEALGEPAGRKEWLV
jgi:hypothetical protein